MKKVIKHNQTKTFIILFAIFSSVLLFSCKNNSTANSKKDTINSNPIIGKTFKLDGLEIAEKDLPRQQITYYDKPDVMDWSWDQADKACKALGDGWRLPTKWELNRMYINADKIGSFNFDKWYWSSTYYIESETRSMVWTQSFSTGIQQPMYKGAAVLGLPARAVRDLNPKETNNK